MFEKITDFISRIPILKHILWLYVAPMFIIDWFQYDILGKNMTAFWSVNSWYMNRALIIVFILGILVGLGGGYLLFT